MNIQKLVCIFLFGFLIAGCTTKISQENFDKIQPGMTVSQVEAILGKPTRMDSIDIAGISGTSAIWKTDDAVIMVQFLDNVVKIKTFSNMNGNDKNSRT